MVIPHTPPSEPRQMSKLFVFWRLKTASTSLISDAVMFLGGALVAFLLLWSLWSFTNPSSSPSSNPIASHNPTKPDTPIRTDPSTFYDDPDLSYSVETEVRNWDEKRRQWLARNPSFSGPTDRVLMVSGSQPGPCKNHNGDYFLLRMFKNKVDYCRIHGYDIFYNNVLLHPKMFGYWAKYAAIRAAMVAHPEAEWIWWVDSDAAITDMDFKLPLDKYRDHNLVVHGWPHLVYEKRSWTGLNAGVLLIRNCQWSMDLLARWVKFGPQGPDYEKWGEVLRSMFKDKLYPESDDQTALAYLLVEEKDKWGDKIYMESEYYLEGYWVDIVGTLGDVAEEYRVAERRELRLRRRHAEKGGEWYGGQWEEYMKGVEGWKRRPFITHFTGCEPCSGKHNENYRAEDCWNGMIRALNFADDQVLRNFGYFRPDLSNSSLVQPLEAFD